MQMDSEMELWMVPKLQTYIHSGAAGQDGNKYNSICLIICPSNHYFPTEIMLESTICGTLGLYDGEGTEIQRIVKDLEV